MRLIAILLILANIGAWLYWQPNTTLTTAEAPPSESNEEPGLCYTVNVYDADVAERFQAAANRLNYALEETEIPHWIDGSNWWLISDSPNPVNVADYKRVEPGAFAVGSGPREGHLSLGIFGNRSNAAQFMQRFLEKNLSVELLPYQQRVSASQMVVRGRDVELLINRYQLEFIEKKSC